MCEPPINASSFSLPSVRPAASRRAGASPGCPEGRGRRARWRGARSRGRGPCSALISARSALAWPCACNSMAAWTRSNVVASTACSSASPSSRYPSCCRRPRTERLGAVVPFRKQGLLQAGLADRPRSNRRQLQMPASPSRSLARSATGSRRTTPFVLIDDAPGPAVEIDAHRLGEAAHHVERQVEPLGSGCGGRVLVVVRLPAVLAGRSRWSASSRGTARSGERLLRAHPAMPSCVPVPRPSRARFRGRPGRPPPTPSQGIPAGRPSRPSAVSTARKRL